MSTYWEGSAPPSSVLGPLLSKQSSSILGITSVACLSAAAYAAGGQGGLFFVPLETQVILAGLAPLSWGLHVAAWIQKQNGK
jgi:hypothetical protein